jgi:hypothetical protein
MSSCTKIKFTSAAAARQARAYAAFDAVLLAGIRFGVPLKVSLQVADLASEFVITGERSAGSAISKACRLLWRHRRPGNRP